MHGQQNIKTLILVDKLFFSYPMTLKILAKVTLWARHLTSQVVTML